MAAPGPREDNWRKVTVSKMTTSRQTDWRDGAFDTRSPMLSYVAARAACHRHTGEPPGLPVAFVRLLSISPHRPAASEAEIPDDKRVGDFVESPRDQGRGPRRRPVSRDLLPALQ